MHKIPRCEPWHFYSTMTVKFILRYSAKKWRSDIKNIPLHMRFFCWKSRKRAGILYASDWNCAMNNNHSYRSSILKIERWSPRSLKVGGNTGKESLKYDFDYTKSIILLILYNPSAPFPNKAYKIPRFWKNLTRNLLYLRFCCWKKVIFEKMNSMCLLFKTDDNTLFRKVLHFLPAFM